MRRRDFVASSLSAAAWAIGYAPALQARIRFGYAAITWGGNDRHAIDDIAALGFRGIQLRQSAVATWGDHAAALKTLLAERGLELVALSSGNLTDESLAQHERHAQFVRDAGGHYLQVLDETPRGRVATPDDYRRLARLLNELGRRTADIGIALAYHNHMDSLGESPDEVARILDATDPRFVHFLLDTAHYRQAGGDPVQGVRRHAERLLFLHIKDFDGSRFVELGRGQIDFKAVFGALADVGFEGWAVVELDSVPDGARTPKDSGTIARQYLEGLGMRI